MGRSKGELELGCCSYSTRGTHAVYRCMASGALGRAASTAISMAASAMRTRRWRCAALRPSMAQQVPVYNVKQLPPPPPPVPS